MALIDHSDAVATSPATLMARVVAPVQSDMQAVRAAMRSHLTTDVLLVDQVVAHALASFGKQIRPALLLLVCHALGGGARPERIALAASVELIHTATLLHDDVVDESELRRGSSTANVQFGNAASVLVGDFLYSRAFQLMLQAEQIEVLAVLANATNRIAEGEVMQLSAMADFSLSESRYMQLIERKTGVLFAAAAELGALLSHADAHRQAARTIGDHIGIAFQLMDDLLDYTGQEAQLGKAAGDDTRSGRVTLPMILALQSMDSGAREALQRLVTEDANAAFARLRDIILAHNIADEVLQRARGLVEHASGLLEAFPASIYRDALLTLCAFSLVRQA